MKADKIPIKVDIKLNDSLKSKMRHANEKTWAKLTANKNAQQNTPNTSDYWKDKLSLPTSADAIKARCRDTMDALNKQIEFIRNDDSSVISTASMGLSCLYHDLPNEIRTRTVPLGQSINQKINESLQRLSDEFQICEGDSTVITKNSPAKYEAIRKRYT